MKFLALRLSLECGIVWRMIKRGFHVYFIYYAYVHWHSEFFNYGILSYFLMRMHSCITWVIKKNNKSKGKNGFESFSCSFPLGDEKVRMDETGNRGSESKAKWDISKYSDTIYIFKSQWYLKSEDYLRSCTSLW